MAKKSLADLLKAAAVFGVGGWLLENALSDVPRFSHAFGGAQVPLLPVYALGGLTVVTMAPALRGLPLATRGAAYAGILTLLELAGCKVERAAGAESWDYGPNVLSSDGCIDPAHSIAWGALGLAAEAIVR